MSEPKQPLLPPGTGPKLGRALLDLLAALLWFVLALVCGSDSTDLFGTDFITAPAKPRVKKPGGDDGGDGGDDGGGGGDDPLPLPEIKTGHDGTVVMQGRYILQERLVDGVRREVAVPLDDYRQEMVARRQLATVTREGILMARCQEMPPRPPPPAG